MFEFTESKGTFSGGVSFGFVGIDSDPVEVRSGLLSLAGMAACMAVEIIAPH